MAAIAREVVFALLRTDFGDSFGDCCDERFDGSGGDLSQQGFEFGEELFDGVEVWAVQGQVAQLGAGGLDGSSFSRSMRRAKSRRWTAPSRVADEEGRTGTVTHDYRRHGLTTQFAALDVLEGKVIGQCMKRHRHQEFVRFLNVESCKSCKPPAMPLSISALKTAKAASAL